MPKIIENLQAKLVEETGRQIAQSGYHALTVRSVAKACGVGVGTVYNYYPSKDDLVAAYMLLGWKGCMERIQTASRQAESAEAVLRCIYDQLLHFARTHRGILEDAAAVTGFAGAFSRYHGLLRSQLAQPLQPWFPDSFCREFAAEAMLTWTMDGREFSQIYGVLQKICEEK